jgi:hypothetical protein
MARQSRERGKSVAVFEHGDTEYTVDVDAELHIDRGDIQKCFVDQPGKYAWYATIYAAALTNVDRCKLELEVTKSRVASGMRSSVDSKGKVPSEATIDKLLPGDEEVIAAEEKLISAKHQEGVLRAVKEAFQHRRDMLIQLGYDLRLEQRT